MEYRGIKYVIKHMVAFEGYSWIVELPDGHVLRSTAKLKASAEKAAQRRIDQWLKENQPKIVG